MESIRFDFVPFRTDLIRCRSERDSIQMQCGPLWRDFGPIWFGVGPMGADVGPKWVDSRMVFGASLRFRVPGPPIPTTDSCTPYY